MASAIGTAKVKANSGLNVRAKASTSAKKLGCLSNGTTVNYYSDSNGWLQIKYNGSNGYISKQYTSVTSGGTSGASSASSGASGSVKVTASALNVRASNSTSSAIIGSLSKGKVVSYSGESNGWLKISYNGRVGWISKQ